MTNINSNNSGFLSSAFKHDPEKRTSVVISLSESEESIKSCVSIEEVIYVLNKHYNDSILQNAPYHYIVMPDGEIYNIKDTMLTVPCPNSELSEYENDIRVLVVAKSIANINDAQKDSLIEILSSASNEYALLISDTIFIDDSLKSSVDDADIKENLIIRSILKRNSENSIFCIAEHAIDDTILINSDVLVMPSTDDTTSLETIAMQHNLPVSIVKHLNPHITDEYMDNIFFLPNVVTLKYGKIAVKSIKELSRRAYQVREILEVVS